LARLILPAGGLTPDVGPRALGVRGRLNMQMLNFMSRLRRLRPPLWSFSEDGQELASTVNLEDITSLHTLATISCLDFEDSPVETHAAAESDCKPAAHEAGVVVVDSEAGILSKTTIASDPSRVIRDSRIPLMLASRVAYLVQVFSYLTVQLSMFQNQNGYTFNLNETSATRHAARVVFLGMNWLQVTHTLTERIGVGGRAVPLRHAVRLGLKRCRCRRLQLQYLRISLLLDCAVHVFVTFSLFALGEVYKTTLFYFCASGLIITLVHEIADTADMFLSAWVFSLSVLIISPDVSPTVTDMALNFLAVMFIVDMDKWALTAVRLGGCGRRAQQSSDQFRGPVHVHLRRWLHLREVMVAFAVVVIAMLMATGTAGSVAGSRVDMTAVVHTADGCVECVSQTLNLARPPIQRLLYGPVQTNMCVPLMRHAIGGSMFYVEYAPTIRFLASDTLHDFVHGFPFCTTLSNQTTFASLTVNHDERFEGDRHFITAWDVNKSGHAAQMGINDVGDSCGMKRTVFRKGFNEMLPLSAASSHFDCWTFVPDFVKVELVVDVKLPSDSVPTMETTSGLVMCVVFVAMHGCFYLSQHVSFRQRDAAGQSALEDQVVRSHPSTPNESNPQPTSPALVVSAPFPEPPVEVGRPLSPRTWLDGSPADSTPAGTTSLRSLP